jgi:hypothetical protein
LIKLADIKGRSALEHLKIYNGINPYIRKLESFIKNGKIILTDNQIKYS